MISEELCLLRPYFLIWDSCGLSPFWAIPASLIGFHMTLVFVGVTISAGIYEKVVYNDLSEYRLVAWQCGSVLTLSNILVVLGFRQAILDRRQSLKGKA